MFTGIIEEIGKIRNITNNSIDIVCKDVLEGTKIGDSISVNGVCLTVTAFFNDRFKADVSSETFNVTALKLLKTGSLVNLERAMPANGRFGGHIVSGHIDGMGKVVELSSENEFFTLIIELPDELLKYTVKKGSIAVNGISLTIAQIDEQKIKLAIIPHTFENTSLKELKSGSFVNIENDITAKYIEKFLSTGDNRSRIDTDFLQRNGFC